MRRDPGLLFEQLQALAWGAGWIEETLRPIDADFVNVVDARVLGESRSHLGKWEVAPMVKSPGTRDRRACARRRGVQGYRLSADFAKT
jgi:hypothetical protein